MNAVVVVRGAGDLATGTILRLHNCGFRVAALDIPQPSAIRRAVAFCEAVYDGACTVEGVACRCVASPAQCEEAWQAGAVPLLIDPAGERIRELRPAAVVDAILAKRNCGTSRDMAPITVGLGPGFTAGTDVDAVIETQRGHDLGRVLYTGAAAPNTGIPGIIAGYGAQRVLHAPAAGQLEPCAQIGDLVEKNQTIATIGGTPVLASLTGVLRGLIRPGYPVTKGLKIADIDPRASERKNCFSVSDKARCIAGGVLEAILHLAAERGDAL